MGCEECHDPCRGAGKMSDKVFTDEFAAATRCAQLLADYADHDHGYWSSPKDVPRCSGCNSIDECDFTMNLRRQFKEAVLVWRKSRGLA